jgi:spermidine synthase
LDGLVRAVALLLTLLTGFSGLVYEVTWQKYLATLLGSHSEATAAVLALFLGGLSAGYSIFGALTRRVVAAAERSGAPPRLLLLYGAIESGIGLTALVFPFLFRGVQALSLAIPHAAGGLGFALDVALSALLVLPPAVLMGGTIPILTQALSRSLADATRLHAHVYAFNTAGAFFGALAAAFVLIPWLGLERVVLAMGLVNLSAGLTFGAIGLRPRAIFTAPAADDPSAPAARVGVYAVVALLVGFAAMVFQTVLIRLGGLALGSSNFTFSMIVAVFVLCIALGSFVVSALPARIPGAVLVGAQWILAACMTFLYARLNYAPYWAHLIRSWFRDEDAGFYPFYTLVFLSVLLVLILPIGLSGATLPLIFHHLKRKVGDLGAAAGRLYAWNTVGSLLGALLGGYVLFYWLDLDQVYRVGVVAVLAAASLLTVAVYGLPRLAFLLLLVPTASLLYVMPRWDPRPFAAATFRMRQPNPGDRLGPARFFDRAMGDSRVTFYDDDPNSSVAVRVTDLPQGPDPAIVTNGKPDGSIFGDYPTMALAGLLPALFVDKPEYGFVIGFGTGVTVGEVAALSTMKEVTVAEISPGVIRAAPHFEKLNQHALGNGKTRVVVADAYRALLRSDQHYDIIASEPSNPWVAGVEMLFSQEFLRAARDRLRPGGVYAQWFHCYENDSSVVELVLRTYASVFDQVAVWYTFGPDLILLGFKDPDVTRAIDVARLERRASDRDVAAGLRRAGIDSFPALLAHEILPIGLVNAAHFPGDVHTILRPVLSYRAGRAFFKGLQSELPDTLTPELMKLGEERALLGRWVASAHGKVDDVANRQMVDEACKTRPRLCATLLAYWETVSPNAPGIGEKQAELLAQAPFRTHVAPAKLGTLVSFFQGDATGSDLSPSEAEQLTDMFADYYYHGLGFWREVLPQIWDRCRDGGSGGCARARKSAERRVGAIGPSAAAAGG